MPTLATGADRPEADLRSCLEDFRQRAIEIASNVIAGRISPNLGCAEIAGISRSLGSPEDLAIFSLLAHDQSGHESIGITAQSCVPDISDACRALVGRA